MRAAAGLVLFGLALYAIIVAFFYARQGALLYPATRAKVGVAEAGLHGFEDVELATEDGQTLVAWHKPAQPGRVTLVYFHGNGGSLFDRRFRAKLLTEGGRGLLLVSYRGYGGSTGSPSEPGLRIDARAAYDWVAERAPPNRVVLYGESLGTGVAVRLATERPIAGLILDAPFTSTADVAGHHYWYLPIWLLRDQYRSLDRIEELKAPLLVLHGDRDGVIPIALGQKLFAAAPEPKRFVTLRGVDHVSVLEQGGLEPVQAFIGEIEDRLPG